MKHSIKPENNTTSQIQDFLTQDQEPLINQIRIPRIGNLFYINSKSLIIGVLEGEWKCWNLAGGKLILNNDIRQKLNLRNDRQQYCFYIEKESKIVVCDFSLNILIQYIISDFVKVFQSSLNSNINNNGLIYHIPEKNQLFVISQYNKQNFHQCGINNFKSSKTHRNYKIQEYISPQTIIEKGVLIIKTISNSYIMSKQNLKIIRKVNYTITAFKNRNLIILGDKKIVVRDFCSMKSKKEIVPMRKYQAITSQIVNNYLVILYIKFLECYDIDSLELVYYQAAPLCSSKKSRSYYFSNLNNQIFIFSQHNNVGIMEMGKEVFYYQ